MTDFAESPGQLRIGFANKDGVTEWLPMPPFNPVEGAAKRVDAPPAHVNDDFLRFIEEVVAHAAAAAYARAIEDAAKAAESLSGPEIAAAIRALKKPTPSPARPDGG